MHVLCHRSPNKHNCLILMEKRVIKTTISDVFGKFFSLPETLVSIFTELRCFPRSFTAFFLNHAIRMVVKTSKLTAACSVCQRSVMIKIDCLC